MSAIYNKINNNAYLNEMKNILMFELENGSF